MIRCVRLLMVFFAVLSVFAGASTPSKAAEQDFIEWKQGVRQQALAMGIKPETLARAFDTATFRPSVVDADKSQPETVESTATYVAKRLSPERIAKGREMMAKHRELLGRIERQYGVDASYIVAIWGLETSYGGFTGSYPLFTSLVSMAHEPRRREFFTTQLLIGLQMVERLPVDLVLTEASWAGAMGQVQFLPSSYKDYAVDFDGDGFADIWNSVPDSLASIANYLKQKGGWQYGFRWGRLVNLPDTKISVATGLDHPKDLLEWQLLGVETSEGANLPLPNTPLSAALIQPDLESRGSRNPAYLVYGNFRAIMAYNPSFKYAITVGKLAEAI